MDTIVKDNKFIVPVGPQHPALKEPGHFEFSIEGEVVTGATMRLGYAHRGIEKLAESKSWIQNIYMFERVCGICSAIHATAYSIGVEKLAGVEAPPRAQAIRELVCELERVHSHLLWLGVAAHEAGFETLFMYTWRDRETVMDLLEDITGNRVNYSTNVLGGVKFDLTSEQIDALRKGLDFLDERTKYYMGIVTSEETFIGRTRGVGVMTKKQALDLGATGPTARASGVERDVRVESPYASYPDFPVNIILDDAGDLEARTVVRIKELFESYRVIAAILDNLPEGDLTTRMPRRIPAGETVSRVEAPRGELFYFLKSTGGTTPDRVKVYTPTLANWGTVVTLVVGHQLADVPMILAGIDPCFSCNDRSVSVSSTRGNNDVWSWEQLRQHGIDHYKIKK